MSPHEHELTSRYLSYFDGKRVVVTGASGFLGSSLLRTLSHSKCEVLTLGRRSPRFPSKGVAVFSHEFTDFSKSDSWFSGSVDAHVVFHLAAQTSFAKSNVDPSADAAVNLHPALALFEAASMQVNPPRIVSAGTVTQGLASEKGKATRASFYDFHKYLTELAAIQYSVMTNVNAVALRFSNVFGPGPDESSGDRGVLNKMIWRAVQGETLTVFRPGTYLRDYIFVEDVVDAMCIAAVNAEDLGGVSYEISSGNSRSIRDAFDDVARLANMRTNRGARVELVEASHPLMEIDTRHFRSDPSVFCEATGWAPRHSFEAGVLRTVDEILGNS